MTPAINSLNQTDIIFKVHQYEHDPSSNSYGKEAAAKMNVCPERVFKTLVVALDDSTFAISVVPVSGKLYLKSFAKAMCIKKAKMADKKDVERSTGYVLGGVSPIGQKKKLTTIVDKSALKFETIYISAGQRGVQIELSPRDLGLLTGAKFETISK